MDVVLIEKGILTGLVQIKLSWDTDNMQCSYGHTSYCLRLPFHLLKVNSVF